MTRLIDADAIPWLVEGVGEIPVITKEEIDQMPEAVVRCKDCKHYREPNDAIRISYCWYLTEGVNPEDYCSWAERKEDEAD